MNDVTRTAIFDYCLRMGDDRLILGHRLSEWCGHGPILEEDIALSNIALDLVGQSINCLKQGGEVEGNGRTEDDLAYSRVDVEFRHALLVEQPNGDFAVTIARQFLFDVYSFLLLEELKDSSHEPFREISLKSLKEVRYHLRHTRHWMLRLGDGTEESHRRVQSALEQLWPYTDDLFAGNQHDQLLINEKIIPAGDGLREQWLKMVKEVVSEATLQLPETNQYPLTGGREGRHGEHLGHILAEMQILARSHPGAQW